jgi:RNA recognition motif-containing protein
LLANIQLDADAALTFDLKSFKGKEIHVEKYTQTVLWVTNYPPTYDEEKLRELFAKVYLPHQSR